MLASEEMLIPMYPLRYNLHEKFVLVVLVQLNSGIKPINTLKLRYFAVHTSVLCSTDCESSCFAVLKVKEKSCGKNFDSSL